MQKLILKYESEIERYDTIITNKDSTDQEVKDALKIRNRVFSFLEDLKKPNNETLN